LNKEVKIVLYGTEGDPSGTGEEHRSLGVVYVDGKNVNLEMLKMGLAQVDLKHPFPGFDLNPYLETEKEARDADLGIWSLGDCHVNPWDWITEEYARQKALACE